MADIIEMTPEMSVVRREIAASREFQPRMLMSGALAQAEILSAAISSLEIGIGSLLKGWRVDAPRRAWMWWCQF